MKKTAKWLALVLLSAMVTNSMAVYSAGDAVLPSPMEETASDTVELAPAFQAAAGEEVVEWREEGVRHYDLGGGQYQAVVSASFVEDDVAAPAATTPNSSVIRDTYISSANPTTNYGTHHNLQVSDTQTAFFYFNKPSLPDNAYITNAKLYFTYQTDDYDNTSSTPRMFVGAYPVNFSWSESSLTWNQANSHADLGLDACAATATLNEATSPRSASLTITSEVRLWYMSNLKSNLGIAIKRRSGSISSISIKSREASITNGPYFVITYSTVNLPVAEGTYYIRNGEFHNLFMRSIEKKIEANCDENETQNGVVPGDKFCEMHNPPLNAEQNTKKWVFTYLNNGYYTIKNFGDNTYLTVRQGQENTGGNILVREQIFTGYNNQQWKIIEVENNRYIIKPRSSEAYTTDWVMTASSLGQFIGYDIVQNANNGSSDATDEWYIQPLDVTPRAHYNVVVEYDSLAEGDISSDPNAIPDRIEEIFQVVAYRFLVVYKIELTIQSTTLQSDIVVDSRCRTINNRNAYCSPDCGPDNNCAEVHHKHAGNFISFEPSDDERLCRIVGFGLCGEPNGHSRVMGMTYGTFGNKEIVVTTQGGAELDESLRLSIQHELSHTFGAKEHTVEDDNEGGECVVSYRNPGSGTWCLKCYNSINIFH